MDNYEERFIVSETNKKQLIVKLLKGIETGDPDSVAVVNEDKYIQHNPQTHEGSEGLAVLFKRLSKTSPRVNIVRVFEDGDYVFAHTEYDFENRNIGFEIFRFEDGQAVEHWDNIQGRKGPNPAGSSMVDGITEVTDHQQTEVNRALIKSFVDEVLIEGNQQRMFDYFSDTYTEHNPELTDDLTRLKAALFATDVGAGSIDYCKSHRLLAEGNFVLSVSEGYVDSVNSSFFDLFRIEDGKIVEHWDTREAIPPRSEWKNSNGKF